MNLLLSLLALSLFVARAILIKTPADIVFLFSFMLTMILDLFRENSRICRFLYSACCICMCLFCFVLVCLNTVFDITFLITCAIWLVLLFFPSLDNNPCLSDKKTI